MKNRIVLILVALVALMGFFGCKNSNDVQKDNNEKVEEKKEESKGKEVSVVTNTFPAYDWVKNIANGTNVSVKNLTDSGIGLHNYEPTAEDIKSIENSNLFIYVGGESDEWAPGAIKNAPNTTAINMMEVLKDRIKPEEMVEGMEGHDHDHEHGDEDEDHDHDHDEEDEHDHDHDHDEHDEDEDDHDHDHDKKDDHDDHDHDHDKKDDHDEHDHDHDKKDEECCDEHDEHDEHDHDEHDEHEHGHHHHHGDEVEMDEHVWLSLKNAKLVCAKICDELKKLDPENAQKFDDNLKEYTKKLDDLDKKYEEATSGENKVVLFGDRFPFRYMVDDYNIKYYAAFVGCSQESEASFETIAFLANKVDELGLKSIFTLSDSDHKIAETIKDNTKSKDANILVMNSLESVKDGDYINLMEENLSSLKEGLK